MLRSREGKRNKLSWEGLSELVEESNPDRSRIIPCQFGQGTLSNFRGK